MPNQQIKSRFDGCVLYECEADSLLEALHAAVKSGANLGGANLGGAYLDGANLARAYLNGANLDGKPILNIIQCSGIGTERRQTTAIILSDDIQIRCGCFGGSLPEFVVRIEKTHQANPRSLAEYWATVAWIQACAKAVRQQT